MTDHPASVNMDAYRRPGGLDGGPNGVFCGAPHPDNPDPEEAADSENFAFCRLLKGHQDREDNPVLHHSAFVHSIETPEEWF